MDHTLIMFSSLHAKHLHLQYMLHIRCEIRDKHTNMYETPFTNNISRVSRMG